MMRKMVLGLVVLVAGAAWSEAGLVVKAETRQSGGQGGAGGNAAMTASFEGDNARIEYAGAADGGMGGMMAAGGYLLSRDGGKTLTLVNPGQKSFMKLDLEKMTGMAGAAMQMARSMGEMKITNPKVEKTLDEAGPAMLGFPTRHIKVRTSYGTTMNLMGMVNTIQFASDEEMWVTDKFKDAGLKIWKQKDAMKTGDAELDALIKAQMNKIDGLPLKTVTVTTVGAAQQPPQKTTVTMEVKDVKEQSIPASLFEVPADYSETVFEMPGLPGAGGMRRGARMPPVPAGAGRP